MLSNLGVNAIGPGEIAVTIGTSGALRAAADRPLTNPAGRTFCYALTDRHWVIGGPVNNGGIVFRWVRDELTGSGGGNRQTAGHRTLRSADPHRRAGRARRGGAAVPPPIYRAIPTKLEAEYNAIAAFQRETSATGSTTGSIAPPPLKEENK